MAQPEYMIDHGHSGIPIQTHAILSSQKRMRKYCLNSIIQERMQFTRKTASKGLVEHFRDVTKMFPRVVKNFFIWIDGAYENIL